MIVQSLKVVFIGVGKKLGTAASNTDVSGCVMITYEYFGHEGRFKVKYQQDEFKTTPATN